MKHMGNSSSELNNIQFWVKRSYIARYESTTTLKLSSIASFEVRLYKSYYSVANAVRLPQVNSR